MACSLIYKPLNRPVFITQYVHRIAHTLTTSQNCCTFLSWRVLLQTFLTNTVLVSCEEQRKMWTWTAANSQSILIQCSSSPTKSNIINSSRPRRKCFYASNWFSTSACTNKLHRIFSRRNKTPDGFCKVYVYWTNNVWRLLLFFSIKALEETWLWKTTIAFPAKPRGNERR